MGFGHDHGHDHGQGTVRSRSRYSRSITVRYEVARYGTKNSRSRVKNETFTVLH